MSVVGWGRVVGVGGWMWCGEWCIPLDGVGRWVGGIPTVGRVELASGSCFDHLL